MKAKRFSIFGFSIGEGGVLKGTFNIVEKFVMEFSFRASVGRNPQLLTSLHDHVIGEIEIYFFLLSCIIVYLTTRKLK